MLIMLVLKVCLLAVSPLDVTGRQAYSCDSHRLGCRGCDEAGQLRDLREA